ncbi:MAG: phytoene desaturase family protein [Spirochaetaceae bacterium]
MKRHDAVIVGGGMGGMIAANYLAKFGKRTVLLEQNHQPGGNMSGFWRKGFYFDGGDQSFESLGIVFPILEDLGVYESDGWTKASFRMSSGDFDFLVNDLDEVEQSLREAFPREPGIEPLFREIKEVSRFLSRFYNPWEFPVLNDFRVWKLGAGIPWLRKLKKWSTFEYRKRACSVIENPELRSWFTNIGYYQMPFLFFAGFWHIWAKDYWYPRGGMQALHNRLAETYEARGGEIRYNRLVTRVEHANGEAKAVFCEGGERFEGKKIIYAGDYKELLRSILEPELFDRQRRDNLLNTRLTEEVVSVYLGVKMSSRELSQRLRAHHPFFFPNYDVIFPDARSPRDVHGRMWVALNHFGSENPDNAPPGKSSLVLQTYSSFGWQNYWENGSEAYPRREGYKKLKEQVAGELVRNAESLLPGLSEKIEYQEVGTPLSLRRFTRNTQGSTGGWCYREDVSPVFRIPRFNMFRTPLRNLYAAGHYSLWPGGVISAALSGRLVANLVAERPILSPLGGKSE